MMSFPLLPHLLYRIAGVCMCACVRLLRGVGGVKLRDCELMTSIILLILGIRRHEVLSGQMSRGPAFDWLGGC